MTALTAYDTFGVGAPPGEGLHMALEHMYTVLCDYVMKEGARWAWVGTFDNVLLSEVPFPWPKFCIAVGVRGAEGDHFRLLLRDPAGESLELASQAVSGQIAALQSPFQQPMLTCVVQASLLFEAEGIYSVVVMDDERVVHERTFGVYVVSEDEDEGAH